MHKVKKLLKKIGPGFITGASDDDPSGIATYSQTGAQFGYMQLWACVFSFPFMTVIQEMCGRIGMVTGKGLSGVIRGHYPRAILFTAIGIVFIANTINIGADLGAMASATQLILPAVPFTIVLIIMTLITLLLEVLVPYPTYSKILKYLTLALLAYFGTALITHQNWTEVIKNTIIPHISFSPEYMLNIVAFLGTTISPYLFFWQADEEVEEEVVHHKLRFMGKGVPRVTHRDVREMRFDTTLGMFLSNSVSFVIILTTAATLFAHGITSIQTADQAATALRPLAGDFAFLLFALGIVGTGFLAVPVLAGSAAYAYCEAVGWKEGLNRKVTKAVGFYGVITLATLIGLFVNFSAIPPFKMLYYAAVLNGVCAPPLMVIILLIGNNKKIMGKFTNSLFSNIFGWFITIVMAAAAVYLLFSFIHIT